QRMGDAEAHDALGRFLFPYEAQFKKVDDLSGGERARLSLLNLTLGRYNLLVLDEPTNHLDVEMIDALEAALQAYEGTLLLVSHDRRSSRRWPRRYGRCATGGSRCSGATGATTSASAPSGSGRPPHRTVGLLKRPAPAPEPKLPGPP